MPVLVSQTYEITDQESRNRCEAKDSGFVKRDDPCTFRELVAFMKNHPHASSYPASGSCYEWYSSEVDTDFVTGDEQITSIHFSRKNLSRNQKYWLWAAKAAGIVK